MRRSRFLIGATMTSALAPVAVVATNAEAIVATVSPPFEVFCTNAENAIQFNPSPSGLFSAPTPSTPAEAATELPAFRWRLAAMTKAINDDAVAARFAPDAALTHAYSAADTQAHKELTEMKAIVWTLTSMAATNRSSLMGTLEQAEGFANADFIAANVHLEDVSIRLRSHCNPWTAGLNLAVGAVTEATATSSSFSKSALVDALATSSYKGRLTLVDATTRDGSLTSARLTVTWRNYRFADCVSASVGADYQSVVWLCSKQ